MNIHLYIFNELRRGGLFGIGTYIRELTFALLNTPVQVIVVDLFSEKKYVEKECIDGVEHWAFPAPISEWRSMDIQEQRSLYFRNVLYLLQIYIKERENLVFHLNYHQNKSFAIGLRRVFGGKVISVAHFSEWVFSIFDNRTYLQKILRESGLSELEENAKRVFEEERFDYAQADRVVSLSSYMQNVLCEEYQFDPNLITVIPNGLRDFMCKSIESVDLRKKWHLAKDDRILLFVGRMDEVKGVSYLLRAFRLVLENYPECRLLVVGNGCYDRYMAEVKDLCLRVSFSGMLNREEVFELYRLADVGVVPSLFEPFGYVSVEMMMHELPIVATATSGLNEVVDESCGLKVPLTISDDKVEIDTDLLAEKIVYLLRNPEEARRLGRNGRKRYLERYSSEVFGQNMLAFYQSLFADKDVTR